MKLSTSNSNSLLAQRACHGLASILLLVGLLLAASHASAQLNNSVTAESSSINGVVNDDESNPVSYANVILYSSADTSIAKVEVSAEDGSFQFTNVASGTYHVEVRYVGSPSTTLETFDYVAGESKSLGTVTLGSALQVLEQATVVAQRAIVEIKADRTVFNVEGTINSTGGDGMSLLRKAPGVVVDNEDNIIVMGRQGVLVYVDGKRSPLSGEALTSFLQGLPADQIDRIDIITNPGAKYEAEGNAGIIDIRLKKNENWGSNGSVTVTASQGELFKGNTSATFNHREGSWNTFITGGVYTGDNFNDNFFKRQQNGLFIDENMNNRSGWQGGNIKLGTDYRMNEKHTIGVLANVNYNESDNISTSNLAFSQISQQEQVDSILISKTTKRSESLNASGNLNYRFDDSKGTTFNLDLDYGAFRRDASEVQPNQFFAPDGTTALTNVDYAFNTPTEIDIYTATADYERPFAGGKLGLGAKITKVVSDNTFDFFQMVGGERQMIGALSNTFLYDEQVEAGYVNFIRDFGPASPSGQGKMFSFTSGLRMEHTNALGELSVLDGSPVTKPVDGDYFNFFPNAGITWAAAPKHTLALSYGRRINRPDYENLNPFRSFASLVTFEQGNPGLTPEIVNNLELAHTFAYRYTTKLSYSKTENQITRLIFKADDDERGQFITYENLAEQTVVALNISVPAQVNKWWDLYLTATGNYTRNVAAYPDGKIDIEAYNFNMYSQHTFAVGGGWKAELSGWFSGPGVWGGTFETRAMGSLNVGAQKKFLKNKLRMRIAVDDILYTNGWNGISDFAGTYFEGGGNWDSRRASISLTYNFGNEKVRVKQRKSGIEDAAGRIGG